MGTLPLFLNEPDVRDVLELGGPLPYNLPFAEVLRSEAAALRQGARRKAQVQGGKMDCHVNNCVAELVLHEIQRLQELGRDPATVLDYSIEPVYVEVGMAPVGDGSDRVSPAIKLVCLVPPEHIKMMSDALGPNGQPVAIDLWKVCLLPTVRLVVFAEALGPKGRAVYEKMRAEMLPEDPPPEDLLKEVAELVEAARANRASKR